MIIILIIKSHIMISTTAVDAAAMVRWICGLWCSLFQFVDASSSKEEEEEEIKTEKKLMKILLCS